MASGPRYSVKFRRRREGKTNYRKRLALLKSGLPRMVVRVTNTRIIVQFIEYNEMGDRVLACADSKNLVKMGWKHSFKNVPAAYLTGLLAGKRALAVGISSAVLDIGMRHPSKGARVFAALKGGIDAGIEIPHSSDKLPDDDRLIGKHISDELAPIFESVKKKIMSIKTEVSPLESLLSKKEK